MNLQDTKAHTQEWQKKKIHSQTVDDGTESFFWFALIYNSLLKITLKINKTNNNNKQESAYYNNAFLDDDCSYL